MSVRSVRRARRKLTFLAFSARNRRVLAHDALGVSPVNSGGAWWLCGANADRSRHELHLLHVAATAEALSVGRVDYIGLPNPFTSRWSLCVPPDQLLAARRAVRDRWTDDAVYVAQDEGPTRLACALDADGGPFTVFRRFQSEGGLALTGSELGCRVGTWISDEGDRRLVGLSRPYNGYIGGDELDRVEFEAFGTSLPSVRYGADVCAERRQLDVAIVTPTVLDGSRIGDALTRLGARAWWYHGPPDARLRIVSGSDSWLAPAFREQMLAGGARSAGMGDGPRILAAFEGASDRLVVQAATNLPTADINLARLFASRCLGRTFLSKRPVDALVAGATVADEPMASVLRHVDSTGRSLSRYPAQNPHAFEAAGWSDVEARCGDALKAMDDGFDLSLQAALLLPVWNEYLRGASVTGRLRWRRLPSTPSGTRAMLRAHLLRTLECITVVSGHGNAFTHEPEGITRLLERMFPVPAPWEHGP